jgi:hypothetical protein
MPRYSCGRSRRLRSAPRRRSPGPGAAREPVSSVEVRARSTPAPARMTGRGAGEELDDGPDLLVGGRAVGVRASSSGASSGSARRAGPRAATAAPARAGRRAPAARASPIAARTSSAVVGSAAHLARPPMVPTWSISWNASRPRSAARPGRRREQRRRVLAGGVDPIARFAPPTARVPRQTAGRPVSWPCASAMNAAAPSCRVRSRGCRALERLEQAQERFAGHGEGVPDAGARSASATNRPTGRGPSTRPVVRRGSACRVVDGRRRRPASQSPRPDGALSLRGGRLILRSGRPGWQARLRLARLRRVRRPLLGRLHPRPLAGVGYLGSDSASCGPAPSDVRVPWRSAPSLVAASAQFGRVGRRRSVDRSSGGAASSSVMTTALLRSMWPRRGCQR